MSMCEMKCDEEKATEEEKEKAAGAELKTKTPHSDVGKKNKYLKLSCNVYTKKVCWV